MAQCPSRFFQLLAEFLAIKRPANRHRQLREVFMFNMFE
jgi:hypothetical protein